MPRRSRSPAALGFKPAAPVPLPRHASGPRMVPMAELRRILDALSARILACIPPEPRNALADYDSDASDRAMAMARSLNGRRAKWSRMAREFRAGASRVSKGTGQMLGIGQSGDVELYTGPEHLPQGVRMPDGAVFDLDLVGLAIDRDPQWDGHMVNLREWLALAWSGHTGAMPAPAQAVAPAPEEATAWRMAARNSGDDGPIVDVRMPEAPAPVEPVEVEPEPVPPALVHPAAHRHPTMCALTGPAVYLPPVGAHVVIVSGYGGATVRGIVYGEDGRLRRVLMEDGTTRSLDVARLWDRAESSSIGWHWDASKPLETARIADARRKAEAILAEAKRREDQARADADATREAGKALLASLGWDAAPPVAVIVAEFRIDRSDPHTDYVGHTTDDSRTLILATSKHTRDLFPELRKAAALVPELAGIEWKEERQKWSMGGGYFITSGSRESGWVIKKQRMSHYGSQAGAALANGQAHPVLASLRPANSVEHTVTSVLTAIQSGAWLEVRTCTKVTRITDKTLATFAKISRPVLRQRDGKWQMSSGNGYVWIHLASVTLDGAPVVMLSEPVEAPGLDDEAPVKPDAPSPAPVEPVAPAVEPVAASTQHLAAPCGTLRQVADPSVKESLVSWRPATGQQTRQLRAAGLSVADLRAAWFAWTKAQQWEAPATPEAVAIVARLSGGPGPDGKPEAAPVEPVKGEVVTVTNRPAVAAPVAVAPSIPVSGPDGPWPIDEALARAVGGTPAPDPYGRECRTAWSLPAGFVLVLRLNDYRHAGRLRAFVNHPDGRRVEARIAGPDPITMDPERPVADLVADLRRRLLVPAVAWWARWQDQERQEAATWATADEVARRLVAAGLMRPGDVQSRDRPSTFGQVTSHTAKRLRCGPVSFASQSKVRASIPLGGCDPASVVVHIGGDHWRSGGDATLAEWEAVAAVSVEA